MRLITKYQFLCLSLEMIKTTFGFTLREWKDPRMDFVKGPRTERTKSDAKVRGERKM